MAETETRRRYVNYGRGEGNIPTHDPVFRVAFKRQKQAAAAAAELEAGTTPELDGYAEKFDAPRAAALFERRRAEKVAFVAEGEAHPEDAETLAYVDVEVVEVDTISGPRRVWADRVDDYDDALGDEEDDE